MHTIIDADWGSEKVKAMVTAMSGHLLTALKVDSKELTPSRLCSLKLLRGSLVTRGAPEQYVKQFRRSKNVAAHTRRGKFNGIKLFIVMLQKFYREANKGGGSLTRGVIPQHASGLGSDSGWRALELKGGPGLFCPPAPAAPVTSQPWLARWPLPTTMLMVAALVQMPTWATSQLRDKSRVQMPKSWQGKCARERRRKKRAHTCRP